MWMIAVVVAIGLLRHLELCEIVLIGQRRAPFVLNGSTCGQRASQ